MRIENEKLVAARIVKKMKELKVSQYELAKRLGKTQSAVSKTLNCERGYPLNTQTIKSICQVLGLNYDDIVSVKSALDDKQPNSKDYERGIMSWILEKSGVYISHVIVSSSIVYRSDKYSNYRFSNGVDSYSKEEMEEIVKRDRQIVEEEGMGLEFEDYYELVYKDKTKRYSVNDYNSLIDNLNEIKENTLELAFNY